MDSGSPAEKSKAVAPPHVPADHIYDLDVYDVPGSDIDFHRAWLNVRDAAGKDVIWTPRHGGHWVALRGDDIHAMIADYEHFSNHANMVPHDPTEGRDFIPLQLDPPEHTPYRSAVRQNFDGKMLRALDGHITELTISLIEGFKDRGECEFMEEFAEVLPVTVFLLLVGLPVEDRLKLRPLGEQLNRPDGSMTPAELMQTVNDYLAPFVDERLANPGADMFSKILSVPINGRPWERDEAMRMCRNLFFGGLDTVVAMFSFIGLFLARNQDRQKELRDDPSLIPGAADEFIRRFSSTILSREIVSDYDLRGVKMRAGEVIVLPNTLHNLDERSFDRPLDIDYKRGVVKHSTMGHGAHLCVGAGLARMEVVTFLREWLSRIPQFRIKDGEAVEARGGGVGTVTHLPLTWK